MARSRAVVVNFGYQLFIIGGCDGGCAAELFTPAISRFQLVQLVFYSFNGAFKIHEFVG